MADKLQKIIDDANTIVVIQADNPDGDSVASALALEQILGDLGKEPVLYCGVEIPSYLRYMEGWDRVTHELPKQFDASIIVDTSAEMLLEMLEKSGELKWVKSKPTIVIDHHGSEATIEFAQVMHVKPAVATAELVYELAIENNWPLNEKAKQFLVMGILSDSLGLISEATSAESIRVVANLVEQGVSLANLDNLRRQFQKKPPEILSYKGELLRRVEYSPDGRVALIDIPWTEIEKYSHQYNPSMLVLDEMRMVEGVQIAIALKSYPNKRITGKIRANFGFAVADKLAEHFGGGGHPYASGFRVTDGRSLEDVKQEIINQSKILLGKIKK